MKPPGIKSRKKFRIKYLIPAIEEGDRNQISQQSQTSTTKTPSDTIITESPRNGGFLDYVRSRRGFRKTNFNRAKFVRAVKFARNYLPDKSMA